MLVSDALWSVHPTIVLGMGSGGEDIIGHFCQLYRDRAYQTTYRGFRLLVGEGRRAQYKGLGSQCPFLREYHDSPIDEIVDYFAELVGASAGQYEVPSLRFVGVGDRSQLAQFAALAKALRAALSRSMDPNGIAEGSLSSVHLKRLAPLVEITGREGGLESAFILIDESESHAKLAWRAVCETHGESIAHMRCLWLTRARYPAAITAAQQCVEAASLLSIVIFESTPELEHRVLPLLGQGESFSVQAVRNGEYDATLRGSTEVAQRAAGLVETYDMLPQDHEPSNATHDFCTALELWNQNKGRGGRADDPIGDCFNHGEQQLNAVIDSKIQHVVSRVAMSDTQTMQSPEWVDQVVASAAAELKALDGQGQHQFAQLEETRKRMDASWSDRYEHDQDLLRHCGLSRLEHELETRQTKLELESEHFHRTRPGHVKVKHGDDVAFRAQVLELQSEMQHWLGYKMPEISSLNWMVYVLCTVAALFVPVLFWLGQIDINPEWRASRDLFKNAKYWTLEAFAFLMTNPIVASVLALASVFGVAALIRVLLIRQADDKLRDFLGPTGSLADTIGRHMRKDPWFALEKDLFRFEMGRWLSEQSSRESQRVGQHLVRVRRIHRQAKWLQRTLRSMDVEGKQLTSYADRWSVSQDGVGGMTWWCVPPDSAVGSEVGAVQNPLDRLGLNVFHTEGEAQARQMLLYPERFIATFSQRALSHDGIAFDVSHVALTDGPSQGENVRREDFALFHGPLANRLARIDGDASRQILDAFGVRRTLIPMTVRQPSALFFVTRRYELSGI